MIFLSMIETPREIVSIMIRPNTFKMADGSGEEASVQKNQNWGYYEAKCVVAIWADEEIQRQLDRRLLSLWKTEYLLPKKAQMQSPR